jgi:hypothetical protein
MSIIDETQTAARYLLMSPHLDERQRRLWVACEAREPFLPYPGPLVFTAKPSAQASWTCPHMIHKRLTQLSSVSQVLDANHSLRTLPNSQKPLMLSWNLALLVTR